MIGATWAIVFVVQLIKSALSDSPKTGQPLRITRLPERTYFLLVYRKIPNKKVIQ